MVKAILLKPLDGHDIGSEAEFSDADFERLKAKGAVKAAPEVKNKAEPAPANKASGKPPKKED
ncbi:hypothetical protein [Sphingobium baderi]|uniref:Uncharacterized protein n=1 Tax=Sphingobium baderi LL03 TaxID=1114964 RepID=T0GA19_9SPHN|nr:hypothetical protein [Sphingobium baderi]EQA96842.1 hypothetical protein L485_22440 [Sphingobium baderi LL03]KMS64141.1 hypothetical protein V475_20360 [Sphingobium baderi LL03]